MSRLLLLSALSALASGASHAQTAPAAPATAPPAVTGPVAVPVPAESVVSPAVLAKDAADLAAMLEGRWDNDLQVFFEPELAVPAPRRHERVHAIIRAVPAAAGFSGAAVYVEHRRGSEAGPVARQRVWVLSPDAAAGGVRMAILSPKDPKPIEAAWRDPERLAALKPADFGPVPGCDIVWRRRAEGFSGETRPGACKVVTVEGERVITVNERHDLSPRAWDVRDIGVDERGTRVFGAPDGVPTRFRKARAYVCWAGAPAAEPGAGQIVFARDLALHDQGGSAIAALAGGNPSSLRIRLRNVEWPFGDNRPSLTLYLLTGADERAEAFAWGEPDAARIALSVRGLQASCTLEPTALWR